MGVLWASAPMSGRDVCGALGRKTPAYTTVMTTLDRLVRKRLLILGGLATSTLLNLLVVPSLYRWVRRS